ncbi:MAG: sugar phosphorylase [Desulfobacterales bacterium]
MQKTEAIQNSLKKIYGEQKGKIAFYRILPILEKFPATEKKKGEYFSEKDIILITYGDTLQSQGSPPLKTLHQFANQYLRDIFSTIHILPFYPFSSDDGFSVIDFFAVNPDLGTWEDIKSLNADFKMMFDFVLNHVSSKSEWFSNYLAEKKGFEDLVIEVDPGTDLFKVTRPRSSPLLTEYRKKSGKPVHVWTTFSADQIDLNFSSIDVLAMMLEVLLYYIKQGAVIIRMDAIAYLWKEIGTNCIHLPQTHEMVKFFRNIFDLLAPDVMNLTETNVPHVENISYFGDGKDEAQMVYNFTLPPLLFYTFVKENTKVISEWAKGLSLESESNTFLNFTASHDGIGVRPLEGILPEKELESLIEIVKQNRGRVSCKKNADGSESPYELNITYVDALWRNTAGMDPYHAARFLASQSIMLVLPGIPAVYIHSLLGSRNWLEGFRQTMLARTINRKKLDMRELLEELNEPSSFRSQIFYQYVELVKIRKAQSAFHPNSMFEILDVHESVFAIKRYCADQTILSVTNVSERSQCCSPPGDFPAEMKDLVSGKKIISKDIKLSPYQYVWLEY